MTDYTAVPAPNYSAPIVNLFGQNGQNSQQQQGQQNQQQSGFVQALQKFLQTGQGVGSGAPMQLASAQSVPAMNPGQIGSLY